MTVLFLAPAQILLMEPMAIAEPVEALEFTADALEQVFTVSIPRLEGMDELEVTGGTLEVRGEATDVPPKTRTATGYAKHYDLDGRDRSGTLDKIVLDDFEPETGPGNPWKLAGEGDGLAWVRDDGETDVRASASGAKPLHILVQRIADDGSVSPPLVASPAFDMPDNSAGLYGPALAGASIRGDRKHGRACVELRLEPPLDARHVRIAVVTANPGQLPNEATAVRWTAADVQGHWAGAPEGLEITARVAGQQEAEAAVAAFPGRVPSTRTALDFTPAARGLMRSAYLNTTGDNVDLELVFRAQSAGRVTIHDLVWKAQYRLFPAPDGAAVRLRGDGGELAWAVPAGLRARGLGVTLDGAFEGPRLLASSVATDDVPKAGYRVAGGIRVAHRVPVTATERGLPLVRLGLLARVSGPTEALVSVHRGASGRLGTRIGPPLALKVPPAATGAFHRVDVPFDVGGPPLPQDLWVVVHVSRGALWWYADELGGPPSEATDSPTLLSHDDGATWDRVAGIPRLQAHVDDLDPDTGEPDPMPIRVAWNEGTLTDDLFGSGATPGQPASFRHEGVALLGADPGDDDSPLARLVDLDAPLRLRFACRRDVTLRVAGAVFTYDPWRS